MKTINYFELLDDPRLVKAGYNLTGLALDSRKVKPGNAFLAYAGVSVAVSIDGRDYIPAAIEQGAKAIIYDSNNFHLDTSQYPEDVLFIPVDGLSLKVGEIAAKFYGEPSSKMKIAGITGTNGKTSISHFISQALKYLNTPCAVIGTIGAGVYPEIKNINMTTPDPILLQKLLLDFVEKNAKYLAIEVSSHGLDQGRVAGLEFDTAIFTNLTRDHLDYHKTMQAYAEAKQKLFTWENLTTAIVNIDDSVGVKFLESSAAKNRIAISLKNIASDFPCVAVKNLQHTKAGFDLHIASPWGDVELALPLFAEFNVINVLSVFACLCAWGFPVGDVVKALENIQSVPGRLQTFEKPGQAMVVVDFAHTPDALEQVLKSLKSHCKGKLFCVFGCGGDRDVGKRPQMAKIAETYADVVCVSNDNPRFEDPELIFKDIAAGFEDKGAVRFIPDRREAIESMLGAAVAGDIVLIAGKGHEDYQIVGDEKLAYSDIDVVNELLK